MAGLWFSAALLPTGWARDVRVTLAEGRIADVAVEVPPAPEDERHGPVVPGLGNLHSHAFQRVMAGLTEHRAAEAAEGIDNFWTWRATMYRYVGQLGPDDVEVIAAQGYLEMLESGFTRVGEFHYLHHDPIGRPYADLAEMASRLIAAAATTGIGLTLLPVFYAHGGFGGTPPQPTQARFLNDLDRFGRLLDATRKAARHGRDVLVGLAPHSLRAVSVEEMVRLAPLADGAPIHIHIAEQAREVEQCRAALGTTPIAWLLDQAPVDPRWCLVHALHATPEERAAIIARGAVVGLCPVTEANLGDGLFPTRDYVAQGGRFGVGTDSNIRIDLADELRQLEYGQRLARQARNLLATRDNPSTGRGLLDRARAGAAQALGVPEPAIAPGRPADLVALDPDHLALVGRAGDALLDSWIFAARDNPVRTVWRGGSRVVVEGRHAQRASITPRFRQVLAKLASR